VKGEKRIAPRPSLFTLRQRRITMLKNHFKIAIRNLLKYKGYSFINIAGLGLGMACCMIILLYIQHELSYDRYHKNAEQIYRVIRKVDLRGQETGVANTPAPLATALMNDVPAIRSAVRFARAPRVGEALVQYESKRFYEKRIFLTDAEVFDAFDFTLAKGNPKTALKEPNAILLTEEMAAKYFGQEDPIDKILTIFTVESENNVNVKVTGVLENIPGNSHFGFDFLGSIEIAKLFFNRDDFLARWDANSVYTYIKIPRDVSPSQLSGFLPEIAKKYWAPHWITDFNLRLLLQPLTGIHLHSDLFMEIEPNGKAMYIYIFATIAIFILIVACINFINLTTAQSVNRATEVGMRKVLGAQRAQLIKQFLSESIFLSLIAFGLAICLVELFIPTFNGIFNKALALDFTNNLSGGLALLGIALLAGFISAGYPALLISAFNPIIILKGKLSSQSAGAGLRKILVTLQFAVSTILIVGTFTVKAQLDYARSKELGFDKERVVVIPIRDHDEKEPLTVLKNRFRQNPNVIDVSACSSLPGSSLIELIRVYPGGRQEDHEPWAIRVMQVDYNFIETMDIEILMGRSFSEEFVTDADEAFILNLTAVEQFGWRDPIGKKFAERDGRQGHVIGVINDFHFLSLHNAIEPLVFYMDPDAGDYNYIVVRISPVDIEGTLQFLSDSWEAFDPTYPFEYTFLDEDFDKLYKSDQRLGRLLNYFSILAIFIALLGLFGLASFIINQRTKEIGIRKVLGATVANVTALLSKDFVKLVLLANLIAWPAAWYAMNKWLQNFAYRIDIGWPVFALAGGLALAIALLTVSTQAIKAALANPVEALRYE
jgi:putative ABC transport system permease protein